MRVAYVCADPGIPVFGVKGSSIHVQGITAAFLRSGVDLDLFASRVGSERPPGYEKVRVHELPRFKEREDARDNAECLTRFESELRDALVRFGPFDLVYERHALWSAAPMQVARETGLPGILEVNAPLIEEQTAHRSLLHREMAEEQRRRCFGAAGTIIAVSQEVADSVSRAVGSATVHVVPNGFDADRFAEKTRSGPKRTFTVGFVGSLRPWHGLDLLVDAFSMLREQVPEARLLIVGDGPERDRLADVVARRDIENVCRFTGPVRPERVPEWMQEMDVAVAPYESGRFYFSPIKLFEYMAAGLPVVASRIGQIEEIVEEGVTGLLCVPGDARSTADALFRCFSDTPLRSRLGRSGRDTARSRYSWDSRLVEILTKAERHGE